MTLTPFYIALLVLEGWRLSSLFANERGPFDVFWKLRVLARYLQRHNRFWRRFKLYDGLTCEWCNSIWFMTPIILLWVMFGDVVVIVLLPLAISTLIIGIKYVVQTLENICTYFDNLNKQFKRGE